MQRRTSIIVSLGLLTLPFLALAAMAQSDLPSRDPVEGCTWQQLSDAQTGLTAWTQNCDFGDRKIAFHFDKGTLVQKYSVAEFGDAVIETFDMAQGETPAAAMTRIYTEHNRPEVAARCELKPYTNTTHPAGVTRFGIVPNAAFQAELTAKADPNEVPDPACGELGDWPDGIQYFEAIEGSSKILFLTIGQDAPLYDEDSLKFVPANVIAPVAQTIDECCGYKAGPNGVKADFVLESCSSAPGNSAGGMIPYFDCQSYLLAMLDTYKTLEASLPADKKFCLPADFATADINRILDGEYNYDADAEKRAPEVLLAYLHDTYPCK